MRVQVLDLVVTVFEGGFDAQAQLESGKLGPVEDAREAGLGGGIGRAMQQVWKHLTDEKSILIRVQEGSLFQHLDLKQTPRPIGHLEPLDLMLGRWLQKKSRNPIRLPPLTQSEPFQGRT